MRQSGLPRKSDTTTRSARWRATRSASSSASRSVPVPSGGSCAQHLQRVQQRPPPLARTLDLLPAAERDRAEAVAAACRRPADRDRDPLRDVGLATLARAEGHRRRCVEHEPGHEHALGELDPNVRTSGPRGHVPLDPPHVVAGLVRTKLPELGADAGECRPVVAREQAVDAPPDRQLERTQRRGRERSRPRLGGCPVRCERVDGGRHEAAASRRPRSICGSGTAATTVSSSASDWTSSASARYERTSRCRNASPTSASRSAGHDVVATADQRQRLRGGDQADRAARAGAVGDVVGDRVEPVLARPARRGRDVDRPRDQRRIDVDLVDAPLQLGQLLDREHALELGRIGQ